MQVINAHRYEAADTEILVLRDGATDYHVSRDIGGPIYLIEVVCRDHAGRPIQHRRVSRIGRVGRKVIAAVDAYTIANEPAAA